MKTRILAAALLAAPLLASAQSLPSKEPAKKEAPAKKIAIRAGRLIDAKRDTPITNA